VAVTRAEQLAAVERFFSLQAALGDHLRYIDATNEASLPTSQQKTSSAIRAREALAA